MKSQRKTFNANNVPTKEHICRYCGTMLKPFQKLIGMCNWCVKEISDSRKPHNDFPAVSYAFCDPEDEEGDDR